MRQFLKHKWVIGAGALGGTTTDSGGAAAQPGSTNPSTPSAPTN